MLTNVQLTQAILPVAGLGTRFLPWTKVVPKELLPLGNEPIIARIVDECIDAGIKEICFVISKGKEMIPAYFFENPELEKELKKRGKQHYLEHLQRYGDIDFHTVYQDEQLGDGHAILQAADWVKSDHVAVLFGDDLFTGAVPGIRQLKEAYEAHVQEPHGAIIALENIDRAKLKRYGVVDVEEEHAKNPRLKKLKGLVEKPEPDAAPSTFGIVGRYIIPKSIFQVLQSIGGGHRSAALTTGGGEIRIIDALIAQLHSIPMYGYECEGKRIDTGTPEGYREAVRTLG